MRICVQIVMLIHTTQEIWRYLSVFVFHAPPTQEALPDLEANETAFAIPGLQLSCTGCNCLRLLCLCRRLLLSSSQLLLLRSLCPRQVLSERCSLEQQHLHSVRQWQRRARLRHARVRPLSCVHLAGRGCPRISEPPLSFVLRTLATSSLLSQTSSSASARRACTSL